MKICEICNKELSEHNFDVIKTNYKNSKGEIISYSHYRKYCKSCNNDKRYKAFVLQKYNLTLEAFHKILQNQNNVCAICEKQFKNREPYVDHCHKTNTVRGLLCEKCNFGIGHFDDDPKLLSKASLYLEAWLQVVPEGYSCNSPSFKKAKSSPSD